MKREKRLGFFIFLILICGFILSQLLVPIVLSEHLERGIEQKVPEAEEIEVNIYGLPAVSMLRGYLQAVDVWIRPLLVSGLLVDELHISGENVLLDRKSLYEREIDVLRSDELIAEVTITKEALSSYLQTQFPSIQMVEVTFQPPFGAGISCLVPFLGEDVPLHIFGVIEVEENRWLKYQPQEITVVEFELPEALINMFSTELSFRVDMSTGRFPLEVQQGVVEQDLLLVRGTPKGL